MWIRFIARSLALAVLLANEAIGAPQLAFPINSQVPPVARLGEPFSFTFSPSTFAYDTPSLNYTADGLPSWLGFDAPTRTFSGTAPTSASLVLDFNLTASDSTGSVTNYVTFLVAPEPAPEIAYPIAQQLANQGPVDGSGGYIITPGQGFNITLRNDTFRDLQRPINGYYAVSTGHTPLPSWVTFNADNLSFVGVAPAVFSEIAPPQYFSIILIASDYPGFAGSSASFNLVVGAHQMLIKQPLTARNVSVGNSVNYSVPISSIFLDGKQIDMGNISSITNNLTSGSWLMYDNATHTLSGTPGSANDSTTVAFTIKDAFGGIVQSVFQVTVIDGLFTTTIPSINATVGNAFQYQLNDTMFTSPVNLSVSFNPITGGDNWLSYDSTARTISGTPSKGSATQVNVTVSAESMSFNRQQSQTFQISTTDSNTGAPIIAAAPSASSSNKSTAIALGTVIPILALAAAGVIGFCFWRRRRRRRDGREGSQRSLTPTGKISRPYNTSPEHWPVMDEKAWDEPRRLSALGIFNKIEGNGMHGYVTKFDGSSDGYSRPNSGMPESHSKVVSDSAPQLDPLPYPEEAVVQNPPGYGQPKKSWRRTTLSSRNWEDIHDGDRRSSDGSLATVSTNEIFSVRLVNSPDPQHASSRDKNYTLTPKMAQASTMSSNLPVVNVIPADERGSSSSSIGSFSVSTSSHYGSSSNPYGSQSTGAGQSSVAPSRWAQQSQRSLDSIQESIRASSISSLTEPLPAHHPAHPHQPAQPHDGRWYSSSSENKENMADIDEEEAEYGVAQRVSKQSSSNATPVVGKGGGPTFEGGPNRRPSLGTRAKLVEVSRNRQYNNSSQNSMPSSESGEVAFL